MKSIVENLLSEIIQKNSMEDISKEAQINCYNLYKVLGVQNDERKLCRFLADLLSPSGQHNQNALYLNLFVEKILINGDHFPKSYFGTDNYSNARVHTEINISNQNSENYGFIDIGIWIGKRFIPMEVKIYARDQEYQCYRYYTYAHDFDPETKVCYLGRKACSKPSQISIVNEEIELLPDSCFFQISFEYEILHWLSMCLDVSKSRGIPLVINAIKQSMEVIRGFTKDSIEEKNMDVINAIMSSPNNIQAAFLIEEQIQTVRIMMIEKVLKSLEEAVDDQCTKRMLIKDTQYYYYLDKKDSFYNSKYTSSYPGINYRCNSVQLTDGLELWFRIEIDFRLFAGYCIYDTNMLTQKDDYKSKTINEICSRIPDMEINREDWWISWKYLPFGMSEANEECPDFKDFSDRYAPGYRAYTSLFNEEYFCMFIDRCRQQINHMLDILPSLYSSDIQDL